MYQKHCDELARNPFLFILGMCWIKLCINCDHVFIMMRVKPHDIK
jgi:hypothetical protein